MAGAQTTKADSGVNKPKKKRWVLRIVGVTLLVAIAAGATYFLWPTDGPHPFYGMALEQTKGDSVVKQRLGNDIQGCLPDKAVIGKDTAELKFMIESPEGLADVFATGAKKNGQWETTALRVEFILDGSEHIVR